MADAISNTSPLLYLRRIGVVDWLPRLFDAVRVPQAVVDELAQGRGAGHDVPDPAKFHWLQVTNPTATPSQWLSLDLGPAELAAMALALENPTSVVLLDDLLARRTANAAGLVVWGTLKIVLEAKAKGLTDKIEPLLTRLTDSGMWLSDDICQRILALAGEHQA